MCKLEALSAVTVGHALWARMHYGLCIRQSDFGRGPGVGKGFNLSSVLNFEHDEFKILMRHPRNVKKAAVYVCLGSKEISRLGV